MVAALHRWLGLTLGVVLMSSGLSGALLVIAKPLDRAWNAPLHVASGGAIEPSRLDEAVRRLRSEFPAAELVVRLPREAGASVKVDVRGAWHGEVFVDPADGRELGRRGEEEGLYNALFEWHSSLLAGERGKLALFVAGLAGLAMVVLGAILWWPAGERRWRRAFALRLRGNAARATLDLHRVGGAVLGLAILVSVATGMYMAWRPVSAWAEAISGYRPPAVPAAKPRSGVPAAPLSALVGAAEATLPGGRTAIVVLPARPERAVRVRKQLPDEVHPNGLSSVWLHPQTADVLRVTRWWEGGPGLLGFQYLYPLHTGALGGTAHVAIVVGAGLALFLLGASGVWLWWKRGRQVF